MPLLPLERIPWGALRVRLTLWNTAVTLLMTIAALLAVRLGTRAAIYREADAVLRGAVNEVAMALRDLHPNTDAVVAELRRKAAGHEELGWFTQLLTDDGVTLWKSDRCPDAVANWPVARSRVENLVQAGQYRFARRRITDPTDEPFHVRIGMSTKVLDEDIDALTRMLVPVGVCLSLLTPLAGYWLAVRATKPVADILRTAEKLRPTRLGDRLAVRGTQDELDRLAVTINRLLDQVASHVELQERFVADAAHELRSPLAAVQSSLEVAISHERTPAEYRETLAEVLEETRHLSKIANDLLLLAEAGEGVETSRMASVNLAEVAKQSVAMFAGVAEDRGIEVVCDCRDVPVVRGDAARLRRLFGNLLDNAIRFTPPGGRVSVRVECDHATGEAVAIVADTGVGIAPEHLPRVFDRFYKVDSARSRDERSRSGGLGLAISKSIVEMHGGRIEVSSTAGRGTTITARIPLSAHSA